MKKTLWLTLCLLICVFAFSACDQGNTPPANDDTSTICQHTFGDWNTTKQATCKDDGELVRVCSKCSAEEKTTVSKTNIHTEVIDAAVSATCEGTGLTEGKHCSYCNQVIIEQTIVGALGHKFVTYVPDGNATTESDGTKTAHCDNNGCNETDTIADVGSKLPADHTHSYTDTVTAPTCTEQGYTTHSCTCGHSYTDTFTNATDHKFVTYVSDGNATTEADGTKTANCENNGCNKTDTIADIGSKLPTNHTHSYADIVTAPTCTEQGYTTHSCSCGHSFVDTYVDVLEHSFVEYKPNNDATYDADGTKTATCSRPGCNITDTISDEGSQLQKPTISFVAEGQTISTQTFDPTNKDITVPIIPTKEGFVGKWETFDLGDESIVVNALYVKQEVWDGTSISEGFWDGDGSEAHPFTIATPQQLRYFENSVNTGVSYEGKYIKLCADIDLGGNEWTPIGYGNSEYRYTFKGTFDGADFSVSNYVIKTSHNKSYCGEDAFLYVGLFGYIESASITNLNIFNFSVDIVEGYQSMNFYVNSGGIAGFADACNIINCHVNGNTNIKVSGYSLQGSYYICRLYIGGIAGRASGLIKGSTAAGTYQATTEYVYAGGICGSGSPSIENASFVGTIKADANGIGYAGGIIGLSSSKNIKHSYVNADIFSYGQYDAYCGGITGYQSGTIIVACAANSKLFINRSPDKAYMGGISGYLNSTTDVIDNCFASVIVDIDETLNSLTYYAGGVAGYLKEGSVTNTISNGSIEITTSYNNAFAYAGGIAGFAKGSSVIDKLTISNCIVDMELAATNGISLDVAKIYNSEYILIQNVKPKSEMTSKADYTELSFKEYIDDNEDNLQNKHLWIWDENSGYLYLYFEDYVSTKYTVKVFLEDLNGVYQLYENNEIGSVSGILVFPTVESIEGFITPANQRVIVEKDGTTVVEYKYARETYTLYLVANDGHKTYIYPKYQEKLDGSSLATRDGYTLGGWFYDTELTDEADITELSFKKGETITLYAWWKEENKPSDFSYSVSGGILRINGYTGTDTHIVVPSYIAGTRVTHINDEAFKDCANIISLTLPSTIQNIGENVLSGCTGLSHLTIPFIGKYRSSAQYTNLDEDFILGYFFGVQQVLDGQSAPEGWTKQGAIIKNMREYGIYANIPASLTTITLTDCDTINAYAFYNCANIKSFILNDNITIIGEYAFYNSGLNGSLHLSKLKTICEYAFSNTDLSYMHLPITVTNIASYAFIGTEGIVISCEATVAPTYWYFDWDYSVSKIYWGVTDGSTELSFFYTEKGYVVDKYNGDADIIIVPSSYDDGENGIAPVIGIHDYAFYQSDIVAIIIPNTTNYIGESAFKECDKLVAVILDDGLINIGNNAFRDCSVLQCVAIPATVMTIGERAFQDAGIKTLNILTNSADMEAWVFYSCNDLVNVTIAEGTTQIYHGQFEQCNSIEKIVLPDTMAILDYDAFMNCSSLKTIIIPKTVTEIRDWAFYDCLETLVIFYDGTATEWRLISIGTNNDTLYSCTINYVE